MDFEITEAFFLNLKNYFQITALTNKINKLGLHQFYLLRVLQFRCITKMII